MQTVERYQTTDGRLFDDAAKAECYEAELSAVAAAKSIILPDELNTLEFKNGGGYIQLRKDTEARFFAAYRSVIESYHPGLLARFDESPRGMIGRYLDDGGAPAYELWGLAASISPQIRRLCGQPAYAQNPSHLSGGCLATL